MRVIINADDLGANETVNEAIFEMMSRRRVTSATLLANGPCIEKAVKVAKHFPHCSFGVHLNITEFAPLSGETGLKPILSGEKVFNGELNQNPKKVQLNFSVLSAIIKEWCSQIEKLFSLGINVSHCDSHHHVHTIPYLFPGLKYVQRKYQIRKVRISKNIFKPSEEIEKKKLIKKRVYNFLLRNCYQAKTTSGFTDLITFFEYAKLNRIGHETVEIMVHPGQVEDVGEDVLLSSSWKEELPLKIQLINYNQL